MRPPDRGRTIVKRLDLDAAVQHVENTLHDLYLAGIKTRHLADRLHLEPAAVEALIVRASDRDPRLPSDKTSVRRIRRVPPATVIEGKHPRPDLSASITPDERVHNPDNRTCLTCKRAFEGGQANRIYCSDECRRLKDRERRGEDVSQQIKMRTDPPACEGCGEPLVGRRIGTKCCGDACRKRKARRS